MVVVGGQPFQVGAVEGYRRVGQRPQFHVYPVDPAPLGLEHKELHIIVVLQLAGHGLPGHCHGGIVDKVGEVIEVGEHEQIRQAFLEAWDRRRGVGIRVLGAKQGRPVGIGRPVTQTRCLLIAEIFHVHFHPEEKRREEHIGDTVRHPLSDGSKHGNIPGLVGPDQGRPVDVCRPVPQTGPFLLAQFLRAHSRFLKEGVDQQEVGKAGEHDPEELPWSLVRAGAVSGCHGRDRACHIDVGHRFPQTGNLCLTQCRAFLLLHSGDYSGNEYGPGNLRGQA